MAPGSYYSNETYYTTQTVTGSATTAYTNCTFDFATSASTSSVTYWTTGTVYDSKFIYACDTDIVYSEPSWVKNMYNGRKFHHPEYGDVVIYVSDDATEEEIQEHLEHRYSEIRYQREIKKLTDMAEIKAQDLLKDFIGENELKIYNETGRLYVKGEKGEYIVRKGGTIQKIEGKNVIDFCVHLKDRSKYPPTDNVIALKLLLEEEESNVLKLANRRGSSSFDSIDELPLAACM